MNKLSKLFGISVNHFTLSCKIDIRHKNSVNIQIGNEKHDFDLKEKITQMCQKKYWNNFAYFLYNFLDKIILIVLSTKIPTKNNIFYRN